MDIELIADVCKKLNISHYSINWDNTIDVFQDIDIVGIMHKLPIAINYLDGSFNCAGVELTSLVGFPKIITNGNLVISYNDIESLYGLPLEIEGNLCIHINPLLLNIDNLNILCNSKSNELVVETHFLKAYNRYKQIDEIINK
jgi:hypothetical protein